MLLIVTSEVLKIVEQLKQLSNRNEKFLTMVNEYVGKEKGEQH